MRFGMFDVFDRNNVEEIGAHSAAVKRVVGFLTDTTSEESELRPVGETRENRAGKQPFLPGHVSLPVRAPVEFLKFGFHLGIFSLPAERLNPGCGQRPVIVEARTIFPVIQLVPSDAPASEKSYSVNYGAVKRAMDVD